MLIFVWEEYGAWVQSKTLILDTPSVFRKRCLLGSNCGWPLVEPQVTLPDIPIIV